LKESGSFRPNKSDPFGGPTGRPSQTSAQSIGIPQKASINNRRHI
jgi:hypothetical protein